MDENLKKELDLLTAQIDERIEKAAGQAADSATGKADKLIKSEIEALVNKFNDINARIDAQEVSMKKGFEGNKKETFSSSLLAAVKDGALENLISRKEKSASFEVKADDMTTANSFTGEVIPADRVPGYKFDPTANVNVRQLIPNGTTTSDVVRYVRETAWDNGAAPKAQGASFGQSDFTMQAKDANVRTIGTFLRLSEEMLEDTPQLVSYLSVRAPQKLLTVENAQLLSGDGTGQNLSGIITDATAFAAGGFANKVESANEFDVLTVAINQLALAEYRPDYIMLNPTDFHKILLLKSTTNRYLKDQVYQGLQPNFLGVPVILHTSIPAGDYLVGNFAMGTQMWIRKNISLEFSREDGNNFVENNVTVKINERITLTNYAPLAFVTGDFETDKAALETA